MDTSMDFSNTADTVVVKVSFNGDLRRFSFLKGGSFKGLYEQVVSIIGLNAGAELVLKYADEDGDLITISSDWELNSAIKPGQLLRLTALMKAYAPPSQGFLSQQGNQGFPMQHGYQGFPSQQGNQGSLPSFFKSPTPGPHFGSVPFADSPQASPAFSLGPSSAPAVSAPPFGGPTTVGPISAGPFGMTAGPFPSAPFGGPFHHPGGGFARGCGGWGKGPYSREEWAKLKKERKASCTPEEWKKLKEERKLFFKDHKAHKKEFKKMGKHGHGHGHGHGHRGPQHGHFHQGPPFGHPHPPFGNAHPFGHPHPPFANCDDSSEKLVARFTKDVTIPDGTQIAGNTSFFKTWRIRNEGPAWPAGCMLRLLSKHSDSMSGPESVVVPIEGPIATGVEVDITVPLIAPPKSGRYTAYYKLSTPAGKKFGQRVWVSVVVPSMSPSSPPSSPSEGEKEADKYEGLVDAIVAMGFTVKRHRVFRLLQKHDGDVAKVTKILHEKTQKKAQKEQTKAAKKAEKAAKNH